MKITQVEDAIERGNTGMEKTFKIQANSRAFQILSSNLYANKIKAVIRELSCNALDSHVAAGRVGTPFDVHLPSNMEPYFSVQDYGLGLTHDQIMSIYTTYFESNKTGTNDLIGGLGLGSKSPFSYASSFDVTSTHDGVARSYAMFINEVGHPSVAYMGEVQTSAPNGVLVKMPVKSQDFDAFRENAQEVFRWFSHAPVVSGNSRYRVPSLKVNPTLVGDNWQLMVEDNGTYSRHYNRPYVVMGNVAYPIKSENLNTKFSQLLQWPLLIKFNIGELDVSASREDLSYDPVTVQVIELRLAAVLADLRKVMEAKFVAAKTLWEARVLMDKINRDYVSRDIMRTLNHSGFKPQFEGADIDDGWLSWHHVFPKGTQAPRVVNMSNNFRGSETKNLQASDTVVFVLKDVSNANSRCRQAYFHTKGTGRVAYLIEGVPTHTSVTAPDGKVVSTVDAGSWNATNCDAVKTLMAYLGNPPTILASSLAAPPKQVMKFKGHTWSGGSSSWRPRKMDNWHSEIEMTTAQGGYYVTMEGFTPVQADAPEADGVVRSYSHIKLDAMIKNAVILGIIPAGTQIMGINKTNSKLVKKVDNWIEFSGFVTEKLQALMKQHNVAELVTNKNHLEFLNNKFYSSVTDWNQKFGKDTNLLGEFVTAWKNMSVSISKQVNASALRDLAIVCKVTWTEDATVSTTHTSLADMYAAVEKRYPMIQMFTRTYVGSDEFKLFVDYVKLVDTVTK